MNVLLSINPYWANLIYEKKKIYEMRKRPPVRCKIGEMVFIYETYPVCAVTGYFIYHGYLVFSDIEEFGEHYYFQHRIPYNDFIKYYEGSELGFAWYVSNPTKFYNPIKLPIANITKAPQSFCYLK